MWHLDFDTERANIRHLYWELGWLAFAFAMEWFYLGVYAIHLGATPVHLGVLTGGRSLLLVGGAVLSQRWRVRYSNAIKALRIPVFGYRFLLYFLIALVPALPVPPASQVNVIVALAVLSALPYGVAQGVFLGVLPQAVTKENLAKVIARRSVIMNATILVCMVIVGKLLELWAKPLNYQVGFVIAFVASVISWWHIQQVKTPDVQFVVTQMRRVQVWAYKPFRRFAVVVVALNVSVFMMAPLWQVRLVRDLDATDAWISLLAVTEMGAGALFTLFLDRLIKRFGVRRLLIATAFVTTFQALILATTPILPPYILGVALFGAGWFSANVLNYNRLVEIVPSEDMAQFAAAYQVLINSSLFIGPLLSTFLVENVMNIQWVMLLIAGLRLVAVGLIWLIRVGPEKRADSQPVVEQNIEPVQAL